MKMKLFFAAVTMLFTLGVATSCGNKKAASTTETTEQCDSTKACCKSDSLACDSTKACCEADSAKACCDKKAAE